MLIFLSAEVSYWQQYKENLLQRFFEQYCSVVLSTMKNTSVRWRKVALETMILTFTVWYAEQKTIVKLMRENRTIFFLVISD